MQRNRNSSLINRTVSWQLLAFTSAPQNSDVVPMVVSCQEKMPEGISRGFWQIRLVILFFVIILFLIMIFFKHRLKFAGAWFLLKWTSRNMKGDRATGGWRRPQAVSLLQAGELHLNLLPASTSLLCRRPRHASNARADSTTKGIKQHISWEGDWTRNNLWLVSSVTFSSTQMLLSPLLYSDRTK